MKSEISKSPQVIAAIIAGIFVVISACVTGVFHIADTFIEKDTIVIAPSATTTVILPSQTYPPTIESLPTDYSPTPTPVIPNAVQSSVSTFEVYANLSWQNTGVQIKPGDNLRIIWDGKSKWRGINSGDFSDPLGGYDDPNPNYDCPPLMPIEQAGWNALIAKIGEAGIPSNPFKSVPSGEGTLYLAMNDCDKQRYDNEGSAIVTIEVTR